MYTRFFLALCLGAAAAGEATGADSYPRYIFINRAPGIDWSAGQPDSFTADGFREVADTIAAPENPALRVGVTFVFDFLRYDLETVRQSLQRFLACAAEARVPVLVQFDGQNWWEHRPDLWNWWDPNAPGYDPANAANVEWTGWDASHAVKLCWRNWGSQIRVLPAPNIASPAVLQAHHEALEALVPIITAWFRHLPAEDRWLLGGVKVGHEAGIGYNAYHYPGGNGFVGRAAEDDPAHGLDLSKGLSGGLVQLGYAAVRMAGIADQGDITRGQIAEVTRRYLEALAQDCVELGIPRSRVYTHQGGTYAPWDRHLPFTAACNRYATPGWSFYGVDPRDARGMQDAFTTQGNERWAAVEWWWGAPDAEGWRRNLERTLSFGDCRFVSIFNWDCGFRLKATPGGLEGIRQLVAAWGSGGP